MSELTLSYAPRFVQLKPTGRYWHEPKAGIPRVGVCLHYDGSVSDAGGLGWLQGLPVKASYNLVVLDDGAWGIIAPLDKAAWHAGKSRSSDPARLPYPDDCANWAFYGVCVLTNEKVDVTPRQTMTAAWLTARLFARHGWSRTGELYRVTTHSAEAWERGRKSDPEGYEYHKGGKNPIMTADDVRALVPLFTNLEVL